MTRTIGYNGPVIEELNKKLGCSDILDWLEIEAEQLANLSFSKSTHSVKLNRAIFAARSVKSVEKYQKLTQDACIVPVSEGFKIQYRQGIPRERLRFALAHELGHTYFFLRPGSVKSLSGFQAAEGSTIESLCDYFAGALLLPTQRLLRMINAFGGDDSLESPPPLHLVFALAQEFSVAPQAVARRMVFDIFRSHRIVFCVKREIGEQVVPWHTVWFAESANMNRNTPTGWRIPLDSHGRLIPAELIPDVPVGVTESAMIDGRLYAAALPQSPKESRIPLSKRSIPTPKPALVGRGLMQSDLFHGDFEMAMIAIQ